MRDVMLTLAGSFPERTGPDAVFQVILFGIVWACCLVFLFVWFGAVIDTPAGHLPICRRPKNAPRFNFLFEKCCRTLFLFALVFILFRVFAGVWGILPALFRLICICALISSAAAWHNRRMARLFWKWHDRESARGWRERLWMAYDDPPRTEEEAVRRFLRWLEDEKEAARKKRREKRWQKIVKRHQKEKEEE